MMNLNEQSPFKCNIHFIKILATYFSPLKSGKSFKRKFKRTQRQYDKLVGKLKTHDNSMKVIKLFSHKTLLFLEERNSQNDKRFYIS